MELQPKAGLETPNIEADTLVRIYKLARVRTALAVFTALCMLPLFLFALRLGPNLESTLIEAQSAVAKLNAAAGELPATLQQINMLVEDGQLAAKTASAAMESTTEKLEALDLETLNLAISDLAAIVEPLSKLFKR